MIFTEVTLKNGIRKAEVCYLIHLLLSQNLNCYRNVYLQPFMPLKYISLPFLIL